MNELKVSNKFFVTAIADGSSVSASLYTENGSLTQAWNREANTCVPDWTDPANQPIVYGIIRVNGQQKSLGSTPTWKYNERVITFDENTKISTGVYAGLFQRIDNFKIDGSDIICPAMKVINNLAGVDNIDNDVISLAAGVEIGGTIIDFNISVPVRITELSSTGYFGYISGDSVVSTPTDVAVMYAHLYNGIERIGVSSYTTKWYREGIDAEGSPFAVVNATDPHPAGSTAHSVSLTAAQILDNIVIRVEFYDTSNALVYKAFWNIDDTQDMEEMYIVHGTSNQNNASLRTGERVTFKIWMGRRTDSTYIDGRFHTFELKVTDSNSDTVPIVVASDGVNTISRDNQSGATWADITVNASTIFPEKSGLTTEKGGMATITYDFAHSQGDTITGLVAATGNSSNI